MDLLADVLAVAGVRGTVAATVHAADPWGLSLNQEAAAAFHAITAGTAWLRMPQRPPVALMPGDLVLLPTGAAHALSSDRDTDLIPFDHLAAEQAARAGGIIHIGTQPARTRILCASYRHDPAVSTPLLALLPDVMHAPAGSEPGALQDTVRLLSAELAHPQPGGATVLDRLVDVLLIQLLRFWLRTDPVTPSASWLRALGDPVISAALSALHADPAYPWTLHSLADHVAVSRATLARRFPDLVGYTPGAYLTRWRMDLAARALRDTDEPVDMIARKVGYTSTYAFSRAFSRARALPPGQYRTHSRTRGGSPPADAPRLEPERPA